MYAVGCNATHRVFNFTPIDVSDHEDAQAEELAYQTELLLMVAATFVVLSPHQVHVAH